MKTLLNRLWNFGYKYVILDVTLFSKYQDISSYGLKLVRSGYNKIGNKLFLDIHLHKLRVAIVYGLNG